MLSVCSTSSDTTNRSSQEKEGPSLSDEDEMSLYLDGNGEALKQGGAVRGRYL